MKLQHLSIVFIIIIIPILLFVSYYIGLQIDTISKQTTLDTKLQEATQEAITALEINTLEWNPNFSELQDSKRRDVQASINTFITAISNKLGVSRQAKEYVQNYIPVVLYTLHDGYYIYSNSVTPDILTNDSTGEAVLDEYSRYQQLGEKYGHALQAFIPYSETLRSGSDIVTLNYTMDNFIKIYGIVDGKSINYEGYLTLDGKVEPEITLSAGKVVDFSVVYTEDLNNVGPSTSGGTSYDFTNGEILEETINYTTNDGVYYETKTFKYVYDSNDTKYYYNEGQINDSYYMDEFFYLDTYNRVNLAKEFSNHKFKKIYEPIREEGKTYIKPFYYSLTYEEDPAYPGDETKKRRFVYDEEGTVDYERTDKYNDDILVDSKVPKYMGAVVDYSCRNYCLVSYAITTFFNEYLGGKDYWTSNVIEGNVSGETFKIVNKNNADPEHEIEYANAAFTKHKKEVMKSSIQENLERVVADANARLEGSTDPYKLPELTDLDWDKLLNNVSVMGFLQRVPTGLKIYNNYAIASSSRSNDYVNPKEIYLISTSYNSIWAGGSFTDDQFYHRKGCSKIGETGRVVGYLSSDFIAKTSKDNTEIYYRHANMGWPTAGGGYASRSNSAELECYSCLVNPNEDKLTSTKFDKEYYTALARERYVAKKSIIPYQEVNAPIWYLYTITFLDYDDTSIVLGKRTGKTQDLNLKIDDSFDPPEEIDQSYNLIPWEKGQVFTLDPEGYNDFELHYIKTFSLSLVSIKYHEDNEAATGLDKNPISVDGNIPLDKKGFVIDIDGSDKFTYSIQRKKDDGSWEDVGTGVNGVNNVNASKFGYNTYKVYGKLTGPDGTVYTLPSNGKETDEGRDLTIANNDDMKRFRDITNDGKLNDLCSGCNQTIHIIADIDDVNLGDYWYNLIGSKQAGGIDDTTNAFTKILEGNGHTLNLGSSRGFFNVNSGEIKNITLVMNRSGKSVSSNMGGVAIRNTSTGVISGIKLGKDDTNIFKMEDTNKSTQIKMGGIAAINDGKITGITGEVTLIGPGNIGGIAGENNSIIGSVDIKTTVTNNNEDKAGNNTGGIVGINNSSVGGKVGLDIYTVKIESGSSVDNTSNPNDGSKEKNIGGIAGTNNSTIGQLPDGDGDHMITISVEVTGKGNVGGAVGKNKGTINNVHRYDGEISGTATLISQFRTKVNDGVGGIVGINDEDGKISTCSNHKDVTCNYNGGGIAGVNYAGKIEYSFNTATIKSTSTSYNRIGGIVGVMGGKGKIKGVFKSGALTYELDTIQPTKMAKIEYCYNTGDVKGQRIPDMKDSNLGLLNFAQNSKFGVGGIAGACDDIPFSTEDEGDAIITWIGDKIMVVPDFVSSIANSMWNIDNCYNTGYLSGGGNFVISEDIPIPNPFGETVYSIPIKIDIHDYARGGIIGYIYSGINSTSCNNCFYLNTCNALGGISNFDSYQRIGLNGIGSNRVYRFAPVNWNQLVVSTKIQDSKIWNRIVEIAQEFVDNISDLISAAGSGGINGVIDAMKKQIRDEIDDITKGHSYLYARIGYRTYEIINLLKPIKWGGFKPFTVDWETSTTFGNPLHCVIPCEWEKWKFQFPDGIDYIYIDNDAYLSTTYWDYDNINPPTLKANPAD